MKTVSSKWERDRAVVLDVVRRFGPLSRVQIHELTSLRPNTISDLVRELLEEGWLREVGPSDNPLGRKQILLGLNEDHQFVVGIEFNAELVVAAVMNLSLRIKHLVEEASYLVEGKDGLARQLVSLTRRVLEEAGTPESRVAGIGVADPGLIDSRQGISISSSVLDGWYDVPLRQIFERHFRAPFLLESDTRARTVAERALGVGEMAEDMLYLEYGAGIGLGVVTEGRLLRGSRECAGEFGHTHVIEGGPPCKCGSFGCLEAIVGAPAIAARVRSAVLEGGSTMALELAGKDPGAITGFTVFEAARLGDKMCARVMEEVGRYLALGLANVINLFNPKLVVLDPRLAAAGLEFLDQIIRIVRRQALQRSTEQLSFRFGKLGREAGVLGVGVLLVEGLFEIPGLKLPKFMSEGAQDLASVG